MSERLPEIINGIIADMILDAVRMTDPALQTSSNAAISAFLSFIERKLNVTVIRDRRQYESGDPDLSESFEFAGLLRKAGVLDTLRQSFSYPDEPRLFRWEGSTAGPHVQKTGGASHHSSDAALRAALAETLERYIWTECRDYFDSPTVATEYDIQKRGRCISPARFAGAARSEDANRSAGPLNPDVEYLWIRGHSLATQSSVFLPAQTVSGVRGLRTHGGAVEPRIKTSVTTGLATWPSRETARLKGILEVIERDAYMIAWLNQLSLPRLDINDITAVSPTFAGLVQDCIRYGFRVHIVRLITDAPTYAVHAVIEDPSGHGPRFASGLKASQSVAHAAEGALSEALRGRSIARNLRERNGPWNPDTPVEDIGHIDRLEYWNVPEHAIHLEFLIQGDLQRHRPEPWENESDETHIQRINAWCRKRNYECVTVPLSRSASNPLPWHVEMAVMPEMQPTHLFENFPMKSGARLREVPEMFGYTARTPFLDRPHPFA